MKPSDQFSLAWLLWAQRTHIYYRARGKPKISSRALFFLEIVFAAFSTAWAESAWIFFTFAITTAMGLIVQVISIEVHRRWYYWGMPSLAWSSQVKPSHTPQWNCRLHSCVMAVLMPACHIACIHQMMTNRAFFFHFLNFFFCALFKCYLECICIF